MLLHGLAQGAVSKALDLAVDRQREIATVLRRADRLDVLDYAAQAVLDNAPAAGATAERILVRELDAFLAGVVDAGEADEMRGDFAGRVVAAKFALLIDALDAEAVDCLGGFGGDLALEVHEIAREVGELALELACFHL